MRGSDFVEVQDVVILVEVCRVVVLIFVVVFGRFVGDKFVRFVTLPDINIFCFFFFHKKNKRL